MNTLIVYDSRLGSVQKMARLIARGVESVDDCNAVVRCVADVSSEPTTKQAPEFGDLFAEIGDLEQCDALIIGSPAVDTGDNDVCAAAPINNLDQRGEVRPDGAACDIGAFEGSVEAEPSFFIVPLPSGKVITFNL